MPRRQRVQLLGQGRGVLFIGVSENGDAVIAHAVQISTPVRIKQVGTLPSHQGDLSLGVERRLMLVFEPLNLRQVERRHCHEWLLPKVASSP
jgi:hypothetical protein